MGNQPRDRRIPHRYLITGGAGFIGANFIHHLIQREPEAQILNFDQLTYAGNLESLSTITSRNYQFFQGDICNQQDIEKALKQIRPTAIIHFAAESHVDRSIDGPEAFIRTNILGTFNLLEQTRQYWEQCTDSSKQDFHFLHISTDEVYGSLGKTGFFTEETAYAPNSPYSASKASADHLVRAWFHTYKLPVLTTNCSNNYGPFQFPEKLIPLILTHALQGKALPIYGDGSHIRDWLYVEDHCKAILTILQAGTPGECYNIGGKNEMTNLDVVKTICLCLDKIKPKPIGSYQDQITFVADRPGHDKRYAIDASKLKRELGWSPQENFQSGIQKTILWYLDNLLWVENILSGTYALKSKNKDYCH